MGRVPKIGLASVALFFALDQLVKRLVVGAWGLPDEGMEREVTSFFLLRNVHNHGVSLGFLQMGPDKAWVLIALTGAIAIAVMVWMWREPARWDQIALGMIAGGAFGNILDRVRLGYVQDYANLHFGTWEPFLNFNLADAAITIGVLVLLARALLSREKPQAKRADVENSNA